MQIRQRSFTCAATGRSVHARSSVAEADGAVVVSGSSGLNVWTTIEGASWAFVTVDAAFYAAMRAVNRKLGFEPIGEHVIFGRGL